MNRRTRTVAALVALAAMLFAPLAMAAHACRAADMVAATVAMAHAGHAAMAGEEAPPMDMTLCERHCNDGKVSFQPVGNPPEAAAVPVVPALRIDALQPVALRAPAFDSPYAAAAGPAPPLIGYTVLRI
ncbi:MAG TPA: hypothetical protein VLS49_06030 [Usitatibacter sp.]|nr:hypothetical protein [Usitatibacter sp.]